MTPEQFHAIYPHLIGWIDRTLTNHSHATQSVESLGFPRLPQYYGSELLASAKVAIVKQVPTPPLTSLGAGGFEAFESMDAAGITYLDTYFVQTGEAGRESIHFHELIHVVQWRVLGPERFLATYANGLEKFGYRYSPLEVMAYDAEARFKNDLVPFDAEHLVLKSLGR